MKKIIACIVTLITIAACSPYMYSTKSAGQEDESFIIVLTQGYYKYKDVSLMVDNVQYPIKKVYKTKFERKARPIVVTPGQHDIKIIEGGRTLKSEHIFLGTRETKKVVLQ